MGVHRSNLSDEALPADIGKILETIERELVPGRLLDLALQLQAALQEKCSTGPGKVAARDA